MAGHSKWANIQHRKKAQDNKRGKVFTKIIREITVAVKLAGPDISSNSRLRLAMTKANKNSVPKDTIERAIKRLRVRAIVHSRKLPMKGMVQKVLQ